MKHLVLICSSLLLFSCGRMANEDKKEATKERIVCLAKQYSEIIYALGAEQDLVAVDLSSSYPEAIKKLPTVGYHRALSAEAVLAAKPTLIIHDNNIGPEHVTKQLEQLKIPMKVFETKSATIDSTKLLIQEMGKYFHREKQADSLCDILTKEMNIALANTSAVEHRPKVLIIHFGQASNIYLAVTSESTAAKMIDWAGGTIAVTGQKRMKQLSPEVIAEADPDIIILTDVGYDRLGSVDKVLELPGLAGTKAAKNKNVYRFEEHDIIYLGPRTGQNVLKLQDIIHGSKK